MINPETTGRPNLLYRSIECLLETNLLRIRHLPCTGILQKIVQHPIQTLRMPFHQGYGPGIHPRFHERVFKPMTTLRSRDEVEGSGLGLALVRKIAGNYGGHACLISTGAERGTSVEVRLEGAI